ncbi:transposase [Opitutus sp. ER46]|uniref:IS66 family insertion sequence element accessory protein TnpA n=1 Tax=Opitutus sp. ER46 TaxID=2161864 RepID=UPI000D2FB2B8|nr:transposase [Opitutus sp. ER46]PTY01375.1 hypothetical protein DB354_00035 [Opitutus sp. ER46]
MASIRRNQRYTPQQRQEYVDRFERSGTTQAEFCREAKLHPMTFSNWRRQRQVAASAIFAEVQMSAPAPNGAGHVPVLGGGAVLHLLNGSRLELALGDPAAWAGLGLMLKTLQA